MRTNKIMELTEQSLKRRNEKATCRYPLDRGYTVWVTVVN